MTPGYHVHANSIRQHLLHYPGPGPQLLLIPGITSPAITWGFVAERLAERFDVHVLDVRGRGLSEAGDLDYSLDAMAEDAIAVVAAAGLSKPFVMGHSMGGMLATRFALLYPNETAQLVLVNPIGLEDWKALGVPYRTVDQWYQRELNTSAAGIKQYQLSTYYAGKWRPEFDRWVEMQAGMYNGEGKEQVAWNSALTAEMIFTQPVLYEFGQLKMPVLLMIGELDNTAIAKDIAPAELKPKLGNYAKLGSLQ